MIRRPIMVLSAAVLAITLVLMGSPSDVARANPDPVLAGYDLLETDGSGPTFMDFSGAPLPADFFDPGSDPFTGSFTLEGVPIPSYQIPAGPLFTGLEPTDAIIERQQDAGPADPDTIDIEIVALHLQSVSPIVVTYNGGQNPELWDVDVQVPENDPNQVTGTMTVRHEGAGGGTFDAVLPVKPNFTFQRQSDGQVRILNWHAQGFPPLDFLASGENWCHTANPLVTPPGHWVIEKDGLTTNFFPGINCEPERAKAFFAMDATIAVHAVQPAEVLETNYKCYDIFDDPPVVPPVDLETQFGPETVIVETAAYLCPPALKDGLGDPAAPHLKCYDILGQDPDAIVDLETQFGLEEAVKVGQAKLLCMPTVKTPIEPPGPSSGPLEPSPHYECFDIVGDGPGAIVDLETQFGIEPNVAVNDAQFLCAPALKNGGGDLDAPHLKCYDIFNPAEPPVNWLVELVTQFTDPPINDPEYVYVNYAQLLCVPAAKTNVVDDPDRDGDQYDDVVETACGSDPDDANSQPERLGNGIDDDGDGPIDELQAVVAGVDCDGDGYNDDEEALYQYPAGFAAGPEAGAQCDNNADDDGDGKRNDGCEPTGIDGRSGTDWQQRCPAAVSFNDDDDQYPADFNDDGWVTILDVSSFAFPAPSVWDNYPFPDGDGVTLPGDSWYNARWDLSQPGLAINILDISTINRPVPHLGGLRPGDTGLALACTPD